MYLLVATATPDLRSGFALLVDGTSSARHKVFGMALLGVFGLMITAAMELLSSVMICTCALGTLLCCPVSFSICCWMQCVSSAALQTSSVEVLLLLLLLLLCPKSSGRCSCPSDAFQGEGIHPRKGEGRA